MVGKSLLPRAYDKRDSCFITVYLPHVCAYGIIMMVKVMVNDNHVAERVNDTVLVMMAS